MLLSQPLIWFLLGVGFLLVELMAPSLILIFFAAGSWVTALAAWIFGVGLSVQLLIFSVSSLASLFALRKYALRVFKGAVHNGVDDDYSDSKTGKTALVTKAIRPHVAGEVKVQGSFWRATAEVDIAEGVAVIVEGQEEEDSLTLKVKPV